MCDETQFAEEINALRFELIGSSYLPPHAQAACRRYQGILSRMTRPECMDANLLDINGKLDEIRDNIEKASHLRSPHEQTDAVRSAVTELRMVVDIHLHLLSLERRFTNYGILVGYKW